MTEPVTIEEQFQSWLQGFTVLARAGVRVYPVAAPAEAEGVYAVYRRMPRNGDRSMSGPVNPVTAIFRVTVWSASYIEAVALGEAIRRAIETAPLSAYYIDRSDNYDPTPELVVKGMCGRNVDIGVEYDE